MHIDDLIVADTHVNSAKGSEAVLVKIGTSNGWNIQVYVDLVDMDVTLTTTDKAAKMSNTKIIALPQP